MIGIYQYANGLIFTGAIANSVEEAQAYLANKYGKIEEVYTGETDNCGNPIYKPQFVPNYNKEAFVFKELTIV